MLNSLYYRSQGRQNRPKSVDLVATAYTLLQQFHNSYIILDALDECKEREEILKLMEDMFGWRLGLHILFTSRREKDIEDTLRYLVTDQICIQNAVVDADIHVHICEKLRNDKKLMKWPENVHKEIEKKLMEGANGM
jgi:hypothetical protein